MRPWTRREFLAMALASAGTAAFETLGDGVAFAAPKNGRHVGNLKFLDEFPREFHNAFDRGLNGRLITDLESLSDDARITANDRFFIRTRAPGKIDWTEPWTLPVEGLVTGLRVFHMSELLDLSGSQGEILLECSGNNRRNRSFGLLSSAEWDGVSVASLLKKVNVSRAATRVLVNGFDEHGKNSAGSVPGASWIFSLEQLEEYGAFLATHMNGERLPRDHGFPIRLIVPRWYGCSCIKWVNRIELVDDDAPATGQMLEFANRTHQGARHKLARDYLPASMDQAAMPIRIEKWAVDGHIEYHVAGLMWGGRTLTKDLLIRFNPDQEYLPVQHVIGQPDNRTWGFWSHKWRVTEPGRYAITLKAADPAIRTRRLDIEYYRRSVQVEEV